MKPIMALLAAASILAVAGAASADPTPYSDMKRGEAADHHDGMRHDMGHHSMRHRMMMRHRMHHRMMHHHHMDH